MTTLPNLPTREELDAAWSKLADVSEEMTSVSHRVFAAADFEDEQEVTDEHIAALVSFAHEAGQLANSIVSDAGKISLAVLEDLEPIRREGKPASVPQFNRYGIPNYAPDGELTPRAFREYVAQEYRVTRAEVADA
jgi:hypothetical protein